MLAVPFMALLYFIFTVIAILGQTDANGNLLPEWFTWIRGATFLYFAYWTWRVRSHTFTVRSREAWIGVSVLLTILNTTLHYYLVGTSWQAYHFLFLLVAISAVITSLKWFIGIFVTSNLALALASWAIFGTDASGWKVVGGLFIVGSCLSVFLFVGRRSSILVVHSLRDEASRERDATKEALVVAQRAREDFQQLIERAPDAFLILVDKSIRYANPAFLRSLRHTKDGAWKSSQ